MMREVVAWHFFSLPGGHFNNKIVCSIEYRDSSLSRYGDLPTVLPLSKWVSMTGKLYWNGSLVKKTNALSLSTWATKSGSGKLLQNMIYICFCDDADAKQESRDVVQHSVGSIYTPLMKTGSIYFIYVYMAISMFISPLKHRLRLSWSDARRYREISHRFASR